VQSHFSKAFLQILVDTHKRLYNKNRFVATTRECEIRTCHGSSRDWFRALQHGRKRHHDFTIAAKSISPAAEGCRAEGEFREIEREASDILMLRSLSCSVGRENAPFRLPRVRFLCSRRANGEREMWKLIFGGEK